VSAEEQAEAVRREQTYQAGRVPVSVSERQVILADDGVATGLTIRAAAQAIAKLKPTKLIIAVPVIASEVKALLEQEVDEVVTIVDDEDFLGSVGAYYQDFSQLSDSDVCTLLDTIDGKENER
tara:strand:- start:730 stop:1098 length:369 start_codon:yes stop_codon:yes gene_type:complete